MFQLDNVKVQLLFFAPCSVSCYSTLEVFHLRYETFLQNRKASISEGFHSLLIFTGFFIDIG
jgi:hypothetical protein